MVDKEIEIKFFNGSSIKTIPSAYTKWRSKGRYVFPITGLNAKPDGLIEKANDDDQAGASRIYKEE